MLDARPAYECYRSTSLECSGWSFTESEENAFHERQRKEEKECKLMSRILLERCQHISPHLVAIEASIRVLQDGLIYLAALGVKVPSFPLLLPQLAETLPRLAQLNLPSLIGEEDRTLYFKLKEEDFELEKIYRIPDLLQELQPGYELCICHMQYCFVKSDEDEDLVFLRIVFCDELMAYTAAITLPEWTCKAGIGIDLASSDVNTARALRTLILRVKEPGQKPGVEKSRASRSKRERIAAIKSRLVFELEQDRKVGFDLAESEDNESIVITFEDGQQAAKYLLLIPEIELSGFLSLKYHVPAFNPMWCKNCHHFGHQDDRDKTICDLTPARLGCGACYISRASDSDSCNGPLSTNPRRCRTYVLKEALYEGQRRMTESFDGHSLVPVTTVEQYYQKWVRKSCKSILTRSEADVEKDSPKYQDSNLVGRPSSYAGDTRGCSPTVSAESVVSCQEFVGIQARWGFEWLDLTFQSWEQLKRLHTWRDSVVSLVRPTQVPE